MALFPSRRWDQYFLRIALETARMSKDPSTQVGAVIVGPNREIRSVGFNGFPRGVADTHERLHDRDTKISLIVHAEINAIMNAASVGIPLRGCSMYLCATDHSGALWGGPPCLRCAVETIQAGIGEIISLPFKSAPSRWKASIEAAGQILTEAAVNYREITKEGNTP